MVQRKEPNKLGFQADHLLKSEKRSSNLKPASFQHLDGKNRGSDMKKKTKRSKSIKISDFESFDSPPLKKTLPQSAKSPPLCSPATPPAKAGGGSPNYMKGTTSSEARKETLGKSSDLCKKPIKSVTKSSSLKMVRTLTKSPSFKPVRSVAKKSSRVALSADVDFQKVTCSSAQKDSKFPAYLMLNPGGTEAEGTSVVKVCPYNHCSLNGHYHDPSPPLKCFLKAKRRSMKTQRSFKLQASSSPRRVKPSGVETEEIITELGLDFFVEIHGKKIADGAEEEYKCQVSENLSDASPQSEIDLEENCATGFLSFLAEEARDGSCNNESDIEGEHVSDMEWEEAEFSNFETYEKECKGSISVEDQSEGIKQLDEEVETMGSSDGDSNSAEEILTEDVLLELFCEESSSCSLQYHQSDSEMDDVAENTEISEDNCEESERDSGDSVSAATSVKEAIMKSEIWEKNVEGDGDNEKESYGFEMSPGEGNAEALEDKSLQFDAEAEADHGCGLEELPSGTAKDPIVEQEQLQTHDHIIEDQHDNASEPKISTFEGSMLGHNSRSCGTGPDGAESRVENKDAEVQTKADAELNTLMTDNKSSGISGSRYQRGSNLRGEADECSNRKWTINRRNHAIDLEEEREFNPREPNFLPVVPDPEAEKVDLKHQDMDDRKNAEEWMLDYALQQAVTKLAPARKRKVALLVEAFEKVLPIPKHGTSHIRNTASAFSHSRPVQACS